MQRLCATIFLGMPNAAHSTIQPLSTRWRLAVNDDWPLVSFEGFQAVSDASEKVPQSECTKLHPTVSWTMMLTSLLI